MDKKKLEKAEQKIKQKQEKRAVQDSSSSSKSKSEYVTQHSLVVVASLAPRTCYGQTADSSLSETNSQMIVFFPPLPVFSFDGSTASASQQSNRKEAKMEAVGANRSSDIRISDFDIAFGEK